MSVVSQYIQTRLSCGRVVCLVDPQGTAVNVIAGDAAADCVVSARVDRLTLRWVKVRATSAEKGIKHGDGE